MNVMPKAVWAAMLARLVAPMDHERAAQGIAAMMPMLTLPDAVFTPESVRAVCSTGRQLGEWQYGPLTRVPTFGELETALGRWWAKRQELELLRAAPTPRAALPVPPKEGPTPEVVQQVADRIRAFVGERSLPVVPGKAEIKPRHLSNAQLAVEYQRLGVRNPRQDNMENKA